MLYKIHNDTPYPVNQWKKRMLFKALFFAKKCPKNPPKNPQKPWKMALRISIIKFSIFHEIFKKPWGGPVLDEKNPAKREKPPKSFLYINPYDTGSNCFFFKKCALFSIPFSQNFLIGTFFRSKPRCKKIVTGGGVVQVAKKRAPQGRKHRNFTSPPA